MGPMNTLIYHEKENQPRQTQYKCITVSPSLDKRKVSSENQASSTENIYTYIIVPMTK